MDNYNLILQFQLSAAYRLLGQKKEEKLPSDYIHENKHTVSITQESNDDAAPQIKFFNFEHREVTITNGDKNMDIIPFDQFPKPEQLEEAAQKLKDFGGDPGNWQTLKPGNLAKKPRLK